MTKKKIILIITLFMFFFNNNSSAKYDQLIYDFKIQTIENKILNFADYKEKVILLVNTASFCGFTSQYKELQQLWDKYKDKGLLLVGVPSNSFKQEKETNEAVKEFCEINFNINFPLTSIYDVKGDNAHEIYKWAKKNYGSAAIPKWNFYKILIGKNGQIIDTYSSFTKPLSNKIINKIEKALK